VLERHVFDFPPQVVMYVGHPEDSRRVVKSVVHRIREGQRLPDYLTELVRGAGVEPGMPDRLVSARLATQGEEILGSFYRRFIDETSSRGMRAAFVFLPMVPTLSYSVGSTRSCSSPGGQDS
jgi:hypothetical protein